MVPPQRPEPACGPHGRITSKPHRARATKSRLTWTVSPATGWLAAPPSRWTRRATTDRADAIPPRYREAGVMTRPRRLSLLRSDGGMSQRHGADDVARPPRPSSTAAACIEAPVVTTSSTIAGQPTRAAGIRRHLRRRSCSAAWRADNSFCGRRRPTRARSFSKGDTPSADHPDWRSSSATGRRWDQPAARWDGDHEHGRGWGQVGGVAARTSHQPARGQSQATRTDRSADQQRRSASASAAASGALGVDLWRSTRGSRTRGTRLPRPAAQQTGGGGYESRPHRDQAVAAGVHRRGRLLARPRTATGARGQAGTGVHHGGAVSSVRPTRTVGRDLWMRPH